MNPEIENYARRMPAEKVREIMPRRMAHIMAGAPVPPRLDYAANVTAAALHPEEHIIFEEDQIFFMEALLKQPCRIMQTPVEFYAYRKRAGSATTTPSVKKARDVGTIVSMELSLARQIKDRAVRKFAKHYVGSSFFQLTCIYGLMPKENRREIRRICDFRTKLCCAFHAATRHQRIKNALFVFAPWLVNLVYDLRKKNG